jgi:hypothetical protein
MFWIFNGTVKRSREKTTLFLSRQCKTDAHNISKMMLQKFYLFMLAHQLSLKAFVYTVWVAFVLKFQWYHSKCSLANVKPMKALEMGPTQYAKNDAAKILPFHAGASVVS